MFEGKCPFSAWFDLICAYGLILSTNGVLTPFHHFPQYFMFRSLKVFWRRLWRRVGVPNNQSGVGPHFPRGMPLSSLWCFFSVKTLMLFPFHFWPLCGLIVFMYGRDPIWYTLIRWLWDEMTMLRHFISDISMCNIVED